MTYQVSLRPFSEIITIPRAVQSVHNGVLQGLLLSWAIAPLSDNWFWVSDRNFNWYIFIAVLANSRTQGTLVQAGHDPHRNECKMGVVHKKSVLQIF